MPCVWNSSAAACWVVIDPGQIKGVKPVPLLVIGGGKDIVPEVVVKAAYKLYAASSATTDYESFPDRGHCLVFDHGWREIADFTLAWLKRQGI
jgi:non-heme chloroperoxidase